MFTTHPQDQFIYNNEEAVFECAASGSESLTIIWIKNRSYIQNSHFSSSGKKSILKIKNAKVQDSGVYQCTATNADNETVSSKPAELLSEYY